VDVNALSQWIGDKVAPSPLIAVQGFANSSESEDEEEKLTDPPSARAWLVSLGLASPAIDVDRDGLARLIELRRLIRALIDANATGKQDAAANAKLAAIAAQHPVPVAVGAGGDVGIDLEPVGSVDGLIAQLIGVVMRAQMDGTWSRLKVCAADTCRWAFYDGSKNRRGHWCSMEVCGSRHKARLYRARHKTG